ncbi:hypothetical protein OCH239_17875 [Roseivivax halodurans JCM 10272]|uniref:DUF1643 domain-containing protein n=1 Tax=Roseivivax halodurans JCM 10272 TaxID=1449350 RepID=X7EGT8_9RHOB|nr:DUF1643 domain-containing protein [Roseivivax halodurans]ETX15152.1 hypothetical protein OCH239_17875 [Roseivivax halodurans JCM 10272]
MISRRHIHEGTVSEAFYSECERYRYGLSRVWDESVPPVLFVMLNPSTATELANDPTIHRCETRAQRMGAGGVSIANLFAFRATKPSDLKRAEDPEGPENAALLADWHDRAAWTIAAWGVHGGFREAGQRAARSMADLWHLGTTKDGHPRHPLYVSYKIDPVLWLISDRYAPLPAA